jgi:hypothetical protein
MVAVVASVTTQAPAEQVWPLGQLAVVAQAATHWPAGEQAWPVAQSEAAAHWGAGRTQRPRLQTLPAGQSLDATQASAQLPATQALLAGQSELRTHCAGSCWHAPDWQRWPAPQS